MSLSENDRRFQAQSGKSFPTDAGWFARTVSDALKAEFGNTPSSLKTVAQLTHSNERAARNWFEGKNGPSGENLVMLMRHSELVLKAVLRLADRQDLILAVGLVSLRRQLVDTLAAIDDLPGPASKG